MNHQVNIMNVLQNEVDNPNGVHLYLEGNAWCAYERSAYYLVSLKAPVRVNREIIRDGYDVVLLKATFAMDDMQLPIAPNTVLRSVADEELLFQVVGKIDGFLEWKESQLKDLSA